MASSRHVWNLNVFDRFVLSSWQRFEEGATVEFIQKYILRIYVHPLIEAARSNRRVLNFLQFFVFTIFTILIFLLIFFSYFISLFLTAFPIVNFFVQIISRKIYLLFQNRAQINMEFVNGEESPWKFQWLQASPIDSRRPRRRLIFPTSSPLHRAPFPLSRWWPARFPSGRFCLLLFPQPGNSAGEAGPFRRFLARSGGGESVVPDVVDDISRHHASHLLSVDKLARRLLDDISLRNRSTYLG